MWSSYLAEVTKVWSSCITRFLILERWLGLSQSRTNCLFRFHLLCFHKTTWQKTKSFDYKLYHLYLFCVSSFRPRKSTPYIILSLLIIELVLVLFQNVPIYIEDILGISVGIGVSASTIKKKINVKKLKKILVKNMLFKLIY